LKRSTISKHVSRYVDLKVVPSGKSITSINDNSNSDNNDNDDTDDNDYP